MKPNQEKVLKELMTDPHRSDRETAKRAGVSQPTVTRIRHKLIMKGIIKHYCIVPDLAKLGFDILALTIVERPLDITEQERLSNMIHAHIKDPTVIFAIEAPDKIAIVTRHRNYTAYSRFIKPFPVKDSILASTLTDVLKDPDFQLE